MSNQPAPRRLTRRQAVTGMGIAGAAWVHATRPAQAQETAAPAPNPSSIACYPTVEALKAHGSLDTGDWAETAGFHAPGDGGVALYQLQQVDPELEANGADVIALDSGAVAVLHERQEVNYRMFGACGDGESDDGIQIKLAHKYAHRHQLPVINLSGEFWIRETNDIPITMPVQWGKTTFHIDERFNDQGTPRFIVRNDAPPEMLTDDAELKDALVEQLKPGVQIIPELAPYAGHLLIVRDDNDRIGIRAGYDGHQGWAREELFYVEEEGRILGDIAWEFADLTSIEAKPCNDTYLVIEGGGFLFSGDTPEDDGSGYYHHGIVIERSRTIIREQWMGLEPGNRDQSLEPRKGFYVFSSVYDVTLENIRAMPWEKNRRPPEQAVQQGTYGIGGARMLNCTFRNLTAEGGWVAWGVFGTNLNKNFRVEGCRLNRVDVHFHCWNLYIRDCTIGFKGISVTGGGDLFVEQTTRHGNQFINFRRDYGAKWDGPIRLRGCTLKPSSNATAAILSMRPADFDYQYPLVLGTSVMLEDLHIDYSAAPSSTEPCWLMHIPPFSENANGQRLVFPQQLIFRDITVEGREKGVRLLRVPHPYHYDLRREGACSESRLQPNGTLHCERVQLEKIIPDRPGSARDAQLAIGTADNAEYKDARAWYPKVVFIDCEDAVVYLAHCAASVYFQRCSVNTVSARELRGELNFTDCHLQPDVRHAGDAFYAVTSSLGTRFTNCTLHAPRIDGESDAGLIDRIGFLEINGSLRHYHLNTALSNEIMHHLESQGTELSDEFLAKLRTHHGREG